MFTGGEFYVAIYGLFRRELICGGKVTYIAEKRASFLSEIENKLLTCIYSFVYICVVVLDESNNQKKNIKKMCYIVFKLLYRNDKDKYCLL